MDREKRRWRDRLPVGLALVVLATLSQTSNANDRAEIVRQFLAAFNAHDPVAMAELVTDDIKWLSVNGSAISVELEGKVSFIDTMSDYFGSCPSCRSAIDSLISSGERVSVVEVASWMGRGGNNSQRSMAVYEFSGTLIKAVYYFPEEADLDDPDAERQ